VTRTTTLALCLLALTASGAAGGIAACSSSSNGPSGTGSSSGGAEASSDAPTVMGLVPEVACTDSIDSVYGDPGDVSSQAKGAILKCAKDRDMTAAELQAAITSQIPPDNPPYKGQNFTSGAHFYRVLFRTERGDTNGSPGYSSALLLLPETPRNGGKELPVVVAAHGSVGQAAGCALSNNYMAAPSAANNPQFVRGDYVTLVFTLVGLGYPVIAPDYAGYANWGAPNNPPPTYDSVSDIGKSVLDGARALRKLIPSSVSQQAVIVGHSEGGGAAFSALYLAGSYGLDGVLSGVAVYSPLWLSKRSYGALLSAPALFPLATSEAAAVSLFYHWSHAALLDGPDAAYEVFQPAKVPDLQSVVTNDCWADSYPGLTKNGEKTDNDYFDPAYVTAMFEALGITGNGSCGDGGAAAECQTWVNRMTADWPHLDGGPTQVPVLVWYANNDTVLPPDWMQCVFNRLATDGVDARYCYDPGANLSVNGQPSGHSASIANNADYVADWIAQLTLPDAGAPAEPCQTLPTNDAGVPLLIGSDGGLIGCYSLIPTQ